MYQRYKKYYFRKHFELSNLMDNMGKLNDRFNYTVASFDYNLDVWMSKHITYVVTKPTDADKYK